ncbi:MAG TPA: DUF3592 domain-containing protein [Polyangiales bacterium]|nr:DUF3592 domain-containing protein [Polyangiales bacterium]
MLAEANVYLRADRSTTILMSVLAAAFGGLGLFGALQVYRFERDCVRVPGRILAHETRQFQDKNKRWVPHAVDVYGFTTESGESARYEFVHTGPGDHDPIGATATICYPPGAPERARLSGETLWGVLVMFGIGLTAGFVAWMNERNRRREPRVTASTQKNRAKRARQRRRRK